MIHILKDLLRAYVMDFKEGWEDRIPPIEFAYNNSYVQSIKMAPFQTLYGRKCRSPLYWDEVEEGQLIESMLVQMSINVVRVIRE